MNTNTNVTALTTFAIDASLNPTVEENGVPKITLGNLTRGVKNLEKGKIKVDYTIALILNSISQLDKKVFTLAGYDNFVDYCEKEFSYSKGHVYKLTKIAEKFLTIENVESLVGTSTTSQNTGLIAKDGRNLDIALNTNAVKGLQDKYGFPFSITQMQEMAFLETPDILTLIQEEKVKASMPCSAIREVVKSLKSGEDTNSEEKKQKKEKVENGEIKVKVSKDAERFQSILDIISMVEMEIFKDSDITNQFIKFLGECSANANK
jgi:hypothetical protein